MITQGRLKELLHYDKDTGVFIWLVSTNSNVKIGDVAGCINSHGYHVIGIDGTRYFSHRLAWLYVKGYFPENNIDHIDRDRANNEEKNLREVTQQCNLRNTGNCSTNTSGVKGVSWDKRSGKWEVYIMVSQKRFHLGYHVTLLEAACHRLAAEQAEGWEGCDSNSPAYQYVKGCL